MDRFSYSVVASPLHDQPVVDELTTSIRSLLDDLGGTRTDPNLTPHLVLVATGGTEHALMELRARRHVVAPHEPFVMLAHGGHNSLPGALEALAAIRQNGGRGRIVQLTGADADRARVDRAIVDLETLERFRSTRLGLVGGASDWLVASSPTPDVVRNRWGPDVQVVDSARLVDATATSTPSSRNEFAVRFTHRRPADTNASDQPHVSPADIDEAAAVGTAFHQLVADDHLDAVSVRCFDLLDDPGTSGCLALAALNDVGIVAGCEGDLPSTLAMLWIRYLLDQPSWMANPASIDVDTNTIVLAHCTVAPSMVDSLTLSTHFESGIGVGISGKFADQPITLLRIGGNELDECWIAEGAITARGDAPQLCRTQVDVELHDRSVSDLLERPLGNHLVLAAGHHRKRLEEWWRLAIA